MLSYLNLSGQGFLACNGEIDLHVTADPLIFDIDWFLDGYFGDTDDLILSLYDQSTLIGDYQFGISEWQDAILYDGKSLAYVVTNNTQTNLSCGGTMNLFVNPNSLCIVKILQNVQYSFGGGSNDVIFCIEGAVSTTCDKEYSVTFINSNGTFGPIVTKLNECMFIEDGSSMVCNGGATRVEFFALDNMQEMYSFDTTIRRYFLSINHKDTITTTKIYEAGSIISTSQITGGGHRIYNAWDPFGQPELSMIELQSGFELEMGTVFTAQISKCE